MKKCERCNMTYTDDHTFCTGCGSPLTVIPTVSQPQTAGNNTWTPIQKTGWVKSWGWLLFLILGLICEWSFSVLIGFGLAIVGFLGAMASGSGVKKGAAIVLGVIAAILLIIAML